MVTGLIFHYLQVLLAQCFSDSAIHKTLWWWGLLPNMRILPENELVLGSTGGMAYDSFCVDVPVYLEYLLGKVGELGAKTVTAEVDSLEGVFELPGIEKGGLVGMVNCTGLASMELVPDQRVYPTKGQTVLVKGRASRVNCVFGKDYIAYTIPRIVGDHTLLGGSTDKGNW